MSTYQIKLKNKYFLHLILHLWKKFSMYKQRCQVLVFSHAQPAFL